MAACSQQAPAPPPLPNEILFVRGSAGLQAIEVRDGTVAADLGQRKLAARLSPAGGVAEAYLVDRELAAVEMGRPIQVTRLVELAASVRDAALLPAPGLKNYVGEATVVIVSGADGVDRAFQHGRPLWSRNLGSMRFVGDLALARASDGAWLLVAPETGEPTFASQTCTPGPVAQELGGRPLFDCSGEQPPWWLRAADGPGLFVQPNGDLIRPETPIDRPRLLGRLPQLPAGRPALSPDGTHVYAPASDGVIDQRIGGASSMLERPATSAVGMSRDGRFLYVLGGGALDVYDASSHSHRAGYAVDGVSIELVAAG